MKGMRLTAWEPEIAIERDSDGRIAQGIAIGDTLRQNQALLLTLHQGELKETASMGCGISDMLLDHDPLYWRSLIREQLEMDGQTVSKVKVTRSGIEIESTY